MPTTSKTKPKRMPTSRCPNHNCREVQEVPLLGPKTMGATVVCKNCGTNFWICRNGTTNG